MLLASLFLVNRRPQFRLATFQGCNRLLRLGQFMLQL
jgi:hypothetical protein